MFKAFTANVLQQLLKLRNLSYACPAEGLQWIVSEAPSAGISAHNASAIVGGVTRKAHRARLHTANASAEGVQLAHCASNDFLVIHLHIFEEVLGQVGAMEANAFVRMVAIIVVPV